MAYSMITLENFETIGDWTASSADVGTVAASSVRLTGTKSVSFAKSNSSADSTYAGVYKTISPALNLTEDLILPSDRIVWVVYVSATTNIDSAYIRLGESTTNYLEWRFADTTMIAGWNYCYSSIGKAYLGGTGWAPGDVNYIEAGVIMDAETNELEGILVDSAYIQPANLAG